MTLQSGAGASTGLGISRRGRAALQCSVFVQTLASALPATASPSQRAPEVRDALARARAAWTAANLTTAESAFKAVLAADSVKAHKVEAAVILANASWRIHLDPNTAVRYLALADSIDSTQASASLEWSRLARARRDYDRAIRKAQQALERSETPSARMTARVAVEAARMDSAIINGESPEARRRSLGTVVARLREMTRAAPGDVRPARLLLLSGALADDSTAMLLGWDAYFLIGPDTRSSASPRDGRAAFATSIRRSLASRGDVASADVVVALGNGRLFAIASSLADVHRADAPGLASGEAVTVLAYAAFLDSVRAATDDFYRRFALGQAEEREWRRRLDAAERHMWVSLWPQNTPAFSEARFLEEIRRRFGSVVRDAKTGPFADFNFGHVVGEDTGAVEQYDHRAALAFVELDEMASNGYLSWFWDGRAATGGWNASHMVVQVRPLYATGPVGAWWLVGDSLARRRTDSVVAVDSVRDVARAIELEVTYLPSVARRLARAGALALVASLQVKGLKDDSLEQAFVREYGRMGQAALIAHEGRHAIDRRAGTWFHWLWARVTRRAGVGSFEAELEFNAKLSEIAFAPDPRLAFNAIMANDVGNATAHGEANARVLRGLSTWIGKHSGEIPGFDWSTPALIQLPLLSPDQLRAAARSLDPLARPER